MYSFKSSTKQLKQTYLQKDHIRLLCLKKRVYEILISIFMGAYLCLDMHEGRVCPLRNMHTSGFLNVSSRGRNSPGYIGIVLTMAVPAQRAALWRNG
jgi:hypothetical protein